MVFFPAGSASPLVSPGTCKIHKETLRPGRNLGDRTDLKESHLPQVHHL